MLVERYSLRADSGGAGRHRGGLGAEMVVQALSPFSLTTRIDRMHCKPWGLDGGGEAAGNSIGIRRKGRWEMDLPNAKIFNVRLNRGDAYMMQSGGGGGFGDPMKRDPELVAEDVREGYNEIRRQARRRVTIVAVAEDLFELACWRRSISRPSFLLRGVRKRAMSPRSRPCQCSWL